MANKLGCWLFFFFFLFSTWSANSIRFHSQFEIRSLNAFENEHNCVECAIFALLSYIHIIQFWVDEFNLIKSMYVKVLLDLNLWYNGYILEILWPFVLHYHIQNRCMSNFRSLSHLQIATGDVSKYFRHTTNSTVKRFVITLADLDKIGMDSVGFRFLCKFRIIQICSHLFFRRISAKRRKQFSSQQFSKVPDNRAYNWKLLKMLPIFE